MNLTIPDPDEKTKEYLNIISSEAQSSEKIISDLLNFARMELRDKEMASVSQLVEKILEKHPPPKNVILKVILPASLPSVFVDQLQIGQVLSNLVINAYQAMLEGGQLTIKARKEKEKVHLSLADTGVGIPQENMKKLIETRKRIYAGKTASIMFIALTFPFIFFSFFIFNFSILGGIIFALPVPVLIFLSRKSARFQRTLAISSARIISKKSKKNAIYSNVFDYSLTVEFEGVGIDGIKRQHRLDAQTNEAFFLNHQEEDMVPILYSKQDHDYAILKGEGIKSTSASLWEEVEKKRHSRRK